MDAGTSRHCRVAFDSLAVKSAATKLLSLCDEDYELASRWFGGIELPAKPVAVVVSGYAPSFRSTPKAGVALSPGRLPPPSRLHYLFVFGLSKRFMEVQDRGWTGPDDAGEWPSLTRFLAAQALTVRGQGPPDPNLDPTSAWLESERRYYLSQPGSDEAAVGCRVLFLDYLHRELGYSVEEIVAAPAPTLADVYRKLTGHDDDPLPEFKALVESRYPGTEADYPEARSHTAP